MAQTLNQLTSDLFKALAPHRGTPIMQRIQAFVVQQKGKGVAPYFSSEDTDEAKVAFAEQLLKIVNEEKWEELPAAPSGQATASGGSAPTAAAKPAPAAPAEPATAAAETPAAAAPAPAAPVPAVELPKPARAPRQLVKPATAAEPAADTEQEQTDEQIMAQALARIAAKKTQLAVPAGRTDDEIRALIRQELGACLQSIAEVLLGKK